MGTREKKKKLEFVKRNEIVKLGLKGVIKRGEGNPESMRKIVCKEQFNPFQPFVETFSDSQNKFLF